MPAGALRRVAGALLVLVVALAGVLGLVSVLTARDSSRVSAPAGPGQAESAAGDVHLRPGTPDPVYATDPPTSGSHVVVAVPRDDVALSSDQLLSALERGDVALVYNDRSQVATLRALAASVAGPFTAALAAAGQAVILDPLPTAPRGSITAVAWGHAETVHHPTDPALAAFAAYWLGRGAPGR